VPPDSYQTAAADERQTVSPDPLARLRGGVGKTGQHRAIVTGSAANSQA